MLLEFYLTCRPKPCIIQDSVSKEISLHALTHKNREIGIMMSPRRQSRIIAIQILYQIELTTASVPVAMERFWQSQETSIDLRPFATQLVQGAITHLAVIDDLLRNTSENWKLHRMPVVDLSILRCATYEILYVDDIDPATSINEAVEIAKSYSTPDSSKFINGILDNIRKKYLDPTPECTTLKKGRSPV